MSLSGDTAVTGGIRVEHLTGVLKCEVKEVTLWIKKLCTIIIIMAGFIKVLCKMNVQITFCQSPIYLLTVILYEFKLPFYFRNEFSLTIGLTYHSYGINLPRSMLASTKTSVNYYYLTIVVYLVSVTKYTKLLLVKKHLKLISWKSSDDVQLLAMPKLIYYSLCLKI